MLVPGLLEAVMSDQAIAGIWAFVQSLSGQTTPKDIAILNN
jgi:hypothetical protein